MSASDAISRSRRRRLLIGATAALAVAAATALWFGVPPRAGKTPAPPQSRSTAGGPEAPGPGVGQRAPDFELQLFAGGTLSLRSLRGRPVVLNFWASWCVPCREETPLLVRLHRRYGPRIVFVAVNVEDEDQDARRFLAQYHVDYPAVRSSDDRLIAAYRIMGLPTTVFVGADGLVADKYAGGFIGPEGETALRLRLDRLLKAGAP